MSSLINEHIDFAHKNATRIDPYLSDMGVVTLNKDHLPIASSHAIDLRDKYKGSLMVRTSPGYINAEIKIYYAGSCYYTIPILFPESASESYGATYVKESPVGSSTPIVAFANSNATTINLTFKALSDHLPTLYNNFSEYIDAIKHMTIPKTSGSHVMGPTVTVTIANLSFSGVCDSVSIDYQNLYGDKTYTMADITCQFTKTS